MSFPTIWAVLNVIDALIGDFPAVRKAAAGLIPGWKGKLLSILCRLLRQSFFFCSTINNKIFKEEYSHNNVAVYLLTFPYFFFF